MDFDVVHYVVLGHILRFVLHGCQYCVVFGLTSGLFLWFGS